MEVTATFHGGFEATVEARGKTVPVDEPESAGGGDTGFMPTELLFGVARELLRARPRPRRAQARRRAAEPARDRDRTPAGHRVAL